MEPLSIGVSTIATTSRPYSSGRPMRFGNAASLVRASANSSGMPCGDAGAEQARRDRHRPNPEAAEITRHREHHSGDARLRRRVRDLTDLTFERGDRRGVDDHAALAVFGLVPRHVHRLEPVEVERRDQVELDHAPELGQRVRTVLAERARGDAPARGVHRDVDRRRARRPRRPVRARRPPRRSRRTDGTSCRSRSRPRPRLPGRRGEVDDRDPCALLPAAVRPRRGPSPTRPRQLPRPYP